MKRILSPRPRVLRDHVALCLLLGLIAGSPGLAPVLRAADLAVGALTLEPTTAPFFAPEWLARAKAINQRQQEAARRAGDLAPFPPTRENDLIALPLAAALLPPDAALDDAVRRAKPAIDDAPAASLPAVHARPSDYAASSFSTEVYPVPSVADLAVRTDAFTPAAAQAYVPVQSEPTAGAIRSSSPWAGSGPAWSNIPVPAVPFPAAALPPLAGAGSGAFTDLAATAPVQVRPAPLLTAPQTNALPAGATLYVSEYNGIITKATGSGGAVSTFATVKSGDIIEGIVGAGDSLYAVDNTANSIVKIVISTGAVSTFASLGATNLNPSALATDGTNLYVAFSSNTTIDKVVLATGAVSTFATLPASGSTNNGGLAYFGGNVYVASENGATASNPGVIHRITAAGAVSTFYTFTGSQAIGGLAIDASGTLFTGDPRTSGNQIYKITQAGVESTFATLEANAGPIGLGFDANGILYSANVDRIDQITTSGAVSTFATDSNSPYYLVVYSPVPEPATWAGGVLLLSAAGMNLRRRLRPQVPV